MGEWMFEVTSLNQCWSWPVVLLGPGIEIFMVGIFVGVMGNQLFEFLRVLRMMRARRKNIVASIGQTDYMHKQFAEKDREHE